MMMRFEVHRLFMRLFHVNRDKNQSDRSTQFSAQKCYHECGGWVMTEQETSKAVTDFRHQWCNTVTNNSVHQGAKCLHKTCITQLSTPFISDDQK